MNLPDNLPPEAHEAIIECLRVLADHGKQIREARERAAREQQAGTPSGEVAVVETPTGEKTE